MRTCKIKEVNEVMDKLLGPTLFTEPPRICPKLGCGGTVFIPHEDGWQCFNCMNIIYRASDKVTKKKISFKRCGRNN